MIKLRVAIKDWKHCFIKWINAHANEETKRWLCRMTAMPRIKKGFSVPLSKAKYRKIPNISPGAYIFQRPFFRGLFLEGLIYGGKFAFQNRLG